MKRNGSAITGIIFILVGLALILKHYHLFEGTLLKSYGLFSVGLLLLIQGMTSRPRRRIYFSSVLIFIGLFYILGQFGIFHITDHSLLPAFTIIFGLAFYPFFLFQNRRWDSLLAGNIILIIGFIFLFWHLELIDHNLLISVANTYWPLLLIIFGLIFIFGALRGSGRESA